MRNNWKRSHRMMELLMVILTFSCTRQPKVLFHQLSPEKTNIDFENTIVDNDTFNILEYEYVYNGGGVALADFDRDGLEDIFFTGNMVDNKLYLNRGKMQFEDVSESAGILGKDRWSTGVAVIDINYDGWPDLYVGAKAYQPGNRRTNQLFVNQGVAEGENGPTFVESAAAFGLADTSHTTNAAFFDYDNDGDLDVFLAINEMDQVHTPNTYKPKVNDGTSPRRDKLLRNDWNETLGHPFFTDVSDEAGIILEGYSLGINITDLNRDGWKDIYVTNDYLTNDLLYINNQDGTFTDRSAEVFKHTSHSAMGNDVADLNNDGMVDIVALDMLPEDNYRRHTMLQPNNYTAYINNKRFGYQHQYVRNTLQLNQGTVPGAQMPLFSEISLLAGIHATDWSWTPLVADFDADGYRDIIVTNGFPKDITDHDFIDYHNEVRRLASRELLIRQIPSVKIPNYAFRNNGDLTFSKVSEDWGMTQPSFSNGAAYADLDNDGDLDYVVNNINDPAFVFENRSEGVHNWLKVQLKGPKENPDGLGALVEITYNNGQKQFAEQTIYRGYLSSVTATLHFGLGSVTTVDEVLVTWPDQQRQSLKQVATNQLIALQYQEANTVAPAEAVTDKLLFQDLASQTGIRYQHEEFDFVDFNVQPLIPHKVSQFGPAIAVADVNNDGLEDFYVSGPALKMGRFFVQSEEGTFQQSKLIDSTQEASRKEELGTLFFDADLDGDVDLYLVSGGNEFTLGDAPFYRDRLYENVGGRFELREGALPDFVASGSCVKAADFDQDGDLDLFVGSRMYPHEYPRPVSSYLLRNDSEQGDLKFSIVNDELAPALTEVGMISEALFTDFNNDNWVDLVLAGELMPLKFLANREGKFEDVSEQSGINDQKGWWNSLAAGDFDRDGDMDYVAGNLGRNALCQPSSQEPYVVYAKDFDNNGMLDAVPSLYLPDQDGVKQLFPQHVRGDLIKQIISIKGKFPRYRDIATQPITAVLSEEERQGALVAEGNYNLSSWIENKGNGSFELHALPIEAQFAPIYGMIVDDFNDDGHLDLLLAGNDFGTEVGIGRYDAFFGLLLTGLEKGGFEAVPTRESGFLLPGDAKGLATLHWKGEQPIFVATQNQGAVKVFGAGGASLRTYTAAPTDAYAVVELSDGTTYKFEFYYGSGFLSQATRTLFLPEDVVLVEVYDSQGNRKTADIL